MKQENAAVVMKMSRPTLSAIEAGKQMVYAYEIPKFVALYRVSANELLYGEKWCRQHDRLESYERMFSKLKERDQHKIMSIMRGMHSKPELQAAVG